MRYIIRNHATNVAKKFKALSSSRTFASEIENTPRFCYLALAASQLRREKCQQTRWRRAQLANLPMFPIDYCNIPLTKSTCIIHFQKRLAFFYRLVS